MGGPLGAKMAQDAIWVASGVHFDACWGTSWRQDGPSWCQDGAMLANLAPKCAQEGELEAYLARFLEHLGDFLCILGAIFPKWAKT